jgi:primosomal protein N''
MKRIIVSLLGLALVLLAGCVVTSVYPYYTTKDLTFDPALTGVWLDPESNDSSSGSWTFEKLGDQTYKLTTRDSSETNEFDAHLFTLGNQKFLDCLNRQRGAYAIPTHLLLRINRLQPQLETQLLDYEWLAEQVHANPKIIPHTIVAGPAGEKNDGEGLLTLTADTAQLQKFVRKHLNNTNAWAKPMVMKKS